MSGILFSFQEPSEGDGQHGDSTGLKSVKEGLLEAEKESADHEFYLLDPTKFAKNYDLPGIDPGPKIESS